MYTRLIYINELVRILRLHVVDTLLEAIVGINNDKPSGDPHIHIALLYIHSHHRWEIVAGVSIFYLGGEV